jgi:hypothetical protein
MRIFSAKKPLNRTTARNSFLINQFATPGLGSLMAGRWVAGVGQLILAVIGFCLVVIWFLKLMWQTVQQFNGLEPRASVAWLGETGAVFFVAAWLWSLVTSLSLLREARALEG